MRVGLAVLLTFLLGYAAATEVICYWGSWSHYRVGAGKVSVDDLNPSKCTIYIYTFAKLNPTTYKMDIFDPWLDISLKGYEKFVAMKQVKPSLKTLIAIGGWNDSQGSKYSTMLASPALRSGFVTAAVQFLQEHGFDGLDLDYEYPSAADKPHYAAWVAELKAALAPHGLLLTAAVAAGTAKIDAGYDVPAVAGALDFINVMAYDLHGSWEATVADHHAPLSPRASDSGSGLDVKSVMGAWMSRGAPAAKLAMGIPLYGRSWTVSGADKRPPAAASGAGQAGPYTGEPGSLSYHEICEKVAAGWTVVQDPSGKIGPYAYSGSQWVGYDDAAMVGAKTRWAISQGFGAVMVWDVSSEDVRNTCGGGAWPLLSAIQANLDSTATTTSASTTAATSTTTAASTAASSAGTTASATTSTTTASTTAATSAPGGPFICPSPNGLFADPADCQSYYSCGHGTAYHYTCPAGTLFDPVQSNCNWADQVSCNVGSGGDSTTTTGTTGTTAGTSTTAAGTSTTTTGQGGQFTCPALNGWFADPADCHSFYNCFNGTPHHYTCPAGTSWQQAITNCNWSSVTGC